MKQVVTRRSVLVLQHAAQETPGTILDVLEGRTIVPETIRSFAGERVPAETGHHEGLIVMGGPQSVYEQDRFPYLAHEMKLIESTLREGKPVLGICLGSQLLAAVLGAEIKKGQRKEIGWEGVVLTDDALIDPLWKGVESSFVAFHWHGDVFSLPAGAVSLARSRLTQHQAFRYGTSAYGVLFHLETTAGLVQQMVRAFADEVREAGVDAEVLLRDADEHLPALVVRGREVFEGWAALLGAAPIEPLESLVQPAP